MGGWNLQLVTTNFEFAPEQINQASVTSAGHAHLYLNGEKITRLYSSWYHLPSLPSGSQTLTVTLNANGHEALVHDGQPILDTEVLQIP